MFTPDLMTLAEAVVARAQARGMTLATAESCTGGLVAALITSVAGSSAVLEQGAVTYSNAAKTRMLRRMARCLSLWRKPWRPGREPGRV